MKKQFPPMMNCLNGGYIFTLFVFWIISYMVMPSLRPFLGHGLWYDRGDLSWIDMVYYVINGGSMMLILKNHLSDSFFDVHIFPKLYVKVVLTAVMLMLLWVAVSMGFCEFLFGMPSIITDFVPVSEFSMNVTPGVLAQAHPLLGALILTLVVPFSVCGLFYAPGFAPVCCRKPALAYLNVAFILILVAAIDAFWFRDPLFSVLNYCFQLPVHLIACWAYQKTDNIWTPIFSLGLFNLCTSVLSNVPWFA